MNEQDYERGSLAAWRRMVNSAPSPVLRLTSVQYADLRRATFTLPLRPGGFPDFLVGLRVEIVDP